MTLRPDTSLGEIAVQRLNADWHAKVDGTGIAFCYRSLFGENTGFGVSWDFSRRPLDKLCQAVWDVLYPPPA